MNVNHEIVAVDNNSILAYSSDVKKIKDYMLSFDAIYKFDSTGKQVYKWSSYEQWGYLLNYMLTKTNAFKYKVPANMDKDTLLNWIARDLRGDLFHMNSIQVIPENTSERKNIAFKKGNLLLSFCNYNDSILSFVAIVDPIDFQIKWHYVLENGKPVHTPLLLPNGNLLMYVNAGLPKDVDSSYIVEINPINKKTVWKYVEKFPKLEDRCIFGSCQRLPNGNTLISNHSGYIYEVTREKEIVWQWFNTKQVYRAFYYPYEQMNWILNEE